MDADLAIILNYLDRAFDSRQPHKPEGLGIECYGELAAACQRLGERLARLEMLALLDSCGSESEKKRVKVGLARTLSSIDRDKDHIGEENE